MNRRVWVLLWTPAVVGGAMIGFVTPARASLPSNVEHVTVTSGSTTAHIDAQLTRAAEIIGRITDAGTGEPVRTRVVLYRDGKRVRTTHSGSDGGYHFGGLFAGSFAVCVARGVHGPTGYLGRCYGGAYYGGLAEPAGAKTVTVATSQVRRGVDIALRPAAAIAGRVTTKTGTAIGVGKVFLHNRSSHRNFSVAVNSTGRFTAKGLTASARGYSVCYMAVGYGDGYRYVPARPGRLGRAPWCYQNVAWHWYQRTGSYPASATEVHVSLRDTHSGIHLAVPAGGAISGTVLDARTLLPLSHEEVVAFNASGKILEVALTDSTGHYGLPSLPAARGDRVCAIAYRNAIYDSNTRFTNYQGQCWRNVTYDSSRGDTFPAPPPVDATGVSVWRGREHTGIDFRLRGPVITPGSISGTITGSDGTPIAGALVYIESGTEGVTTVVTDAAGRYKLAGLTPSSTGYVVCARQDSTIPTTPTPATGWAPRCYNDVAWVAGLPNDATRVPVASGTDTPNVNIVLAVGGAIAGSFYVGPGTGTPTTGITVDLFTADGQIVPVQSGNFSPDSGSYSLDSLTPESGTDGYVVCFDGRRDPADPQGYLPQCWNGRSWTGTR